MVTDHKTRMAPDTKTLVITDGVMTYMKNAPTITVAVPATDEAQDRADDGHTLFVIPREGDLLLGVTVSGQFEEAALYQYDFIGRKVVYDKITTEGTMCPFEDGIPLVQCGKNFYVDVEKHASCPDTTLSVSATNALLDADSRQQLQDYTHPDGNPYYVTKREGSIYRHGVRLLHKDGDMYQAFGVCDHGYSANYLGRCT